MTIHRDREEDFRGTKRAALKNLNNRRQKRRLRMREVAQLVPV